MNGLAVKECPEAAEAARRAENGELSQLILAAINALAAEVSSGDKKQVWKNFIERVIGEAYRRDPVNHLQEVFEDLETLPQSLQCLHSLNNEEVTRSHLGIDPLTHSRRVLDNVLHEYSAANVVADSSQLVVEVLGAVLHDIGKLFGPKDANHPIISEAVVEAMADELMSLFEDRYPLEQADAHVHQIEFLVRFHDVCGNIEAGRVSFNQAFRDIIAHPGFSSMAIDALGRLQAADMAATPGMMERFRVANQEVYRVLSLMCRKYIDYGSRLPENHPLTVEQLARYFAHQAAVGVLRNTANGGRAAYHHGS